MKKVLIVEDDPDSRELLKKTLSPHFGQCDFATNGKEAINAFILSLDTQQHYDLICMDIMMPVMDGQTALKEIRKIEQDRNIGMVRVLMTTALGSAEAVMESFVKGSCEGYLTKPFNFDILDAHLKKFGLYQSEPAENLTPAE